ncbi:Manganese-dependent ADP-ribose/CDP-alcohol diphosphatase [Dichanthelium oligosanthes]|uniref:Manganese-dependent ADP-ribose/CDP-alcohol diphosphatase n=1 Tax=Dichanthelium oligosanthes TaxID=888268 RepID=A0A1E5VI27_9POAL|nr:Manganese-dependent ADP-ribose/CDP-alcohol diphosphatase [Dichanthelium oligosanthes]
MLYSYQCRVLDVALIRALSVPRVVQEPALIHQCRWNARKCSVKFSINFGDIVDVHYPRDKSLWAVQKVIGEFDKFHGGLTHHMIGNHCLYILPRSELVSLLRMPTDGSDDRAYYDFSPFPGFRIVVLDAYDVSALGWAHEHPVIIAAMTFLDERNPNSDKNSSRGLAGIDRCFVMYMLVDLLLDLVKDQIWKAPTHP